jgi:hypothetical protein
LKGIGKGGNLAKNTAKNKPKKKCADCNKLVGARAAIQCEGCNNVNLIECLSSISENRIKDFTMGYDKFGTIELLNRKMIPQFMRVPIQNLRTLQNL